MMMMMMMIMTLTGVFLGNMAEVRRRQPTNNWFVSIRGWRSNQRRLQSEDKRVDFVDTRCATDWRGTLSLSS